MWLEISCAVQAEDDYWEVSFRHLVQLHRAPRCRLALALRGLGLPVHMLPWALLLGLW